MITLTKTQSGILCISSYMHITSIKANDAAANSKKANADTEKRKTISEMLKCTDQRVTVRNDSNVDYRMLPRTKVNKVSFYTIGKTPERRKSSDMTLGISDCTPFYIIGRAIGKSTRKGSTYNTDNVNRIYSMYKAKILTAINNMLSSVASDIINTIFDDVPKHIAKDIATKRFMSIATSFNPDHPKLRVDLEFDHGLSDITQADEPTCSMTLSNTIHYLNIIGFIVYVSFKAGLDSTSTDTSTNDDDAIYEAVGNLESGNEAIPSNISLYKDAVRCALSKHDNTKCDVATRIYIYRKPKEEDIYPSVYFDIPL